MIHCEQHRAFLNQPLLMEHAKAEEQSRNQLRQGVNRPVIRIHSLGDIHPFALQLPDDFADNAVNSELGAVDDMRVFRDDKR